MRIPTIPATGNMAGGAGPGVVTDDRQLLRGILVHDIRRDLRRRPHSSGSYRPWVGRVSQKEVSAAWMDRSAIARVVSSRVMTVCRMR